MVECNLKHFMESRFTSVLCRSCMNHMISVISYEIISKLTSFSLKSTKYDENCHSRISRFTQLIKSEITFTLNLQIVDISFEFFFMTILMKNSGFSCLIPFISISDLTRLTSILCHLCFSHWMYLPVTSILVCSLAFIRPKTN